jgi:hypothetical protein
MNSLKDCGLSEVSCWSSSRRTAWSTLSLIAPTP